MVGRDTDGRPVARNVFRFAETYGVPLDVLFGEFEARGWVVSWLHFYREARLAGMAHARILAKLRVPIADAWGREVRDRVMAVLAHVRHDGVRR
jgi:hypothetical protein